MKPKVSKEKMISVRLPRISGRDDAVFVSVGDRQWRIMRGADVTIPECAYDVLLNSELAENGAAAFSQTKR